MTDEEHPEIAGIELRQGIASIAEMTGTMFKELQAQGFNRKEAKELARDWLIATVLNGQGSST
jgi:hypothetical protein